MRSGKSCFNTALKKDLGRFAPVWILYTLGLLLVLLLMQGSGVPMGLPRALAGSLQPFAFVNLGYGLLTALVLFGDLFRSRLCFGLHNLPLRREGWFLAHSLAGLLFNLIPTAAMAAAAAPLVLTSGTENGAFLLLSWLVMVNGQYLFFFGAAVFSMLCAGNALGACLIYGICNFAGLLAFFVADTIYIPMLYGLIPQPDAFTLLCPGVELLGRPLIDWELIPQPYGGWSAVFFLTEHWRYLLICAAAGLVLILAALLLYRKRDLERAGELLAGRHSQPLFLIAYCLVCATVFHFVYMIFLGAYENRYYLLFAGLAVGWFTGQMLLKRSTRVFRLRSWLGFAALAAALGLSLVLCSVDVLGLETRIPERQEIASVTITQGVYTQEERKQPLTGGAIDDALTIHRAALESRAEPSAQAAEVVLEYRLTNGKVLRRSYALSPDSPAGALLKKHFSSLRAVTGLDALTYGQVTHFAVNGNELPRQYWAQPEVEALFGAIEEDCRQGLLAQDYRLHPYTLGEDGVLEIDMLWLTLHWGETYLYIDVFPDSENVMSWLRQRGLDTWLLEAEG